MIIFLGKNNFFFTSENVDDNRLTELCMHLPIDRSPMTEVENNEPKPVAERLLFSCPHC